MLNLGDAVVDAALGGAVDVAVFVLDLAALEAVLLEAATADEVLDDAAVVLRVGLGLRDDDLGVVLGLGPFLAEDLDDAADEVVVVDDDGDTLLLFGERGELV